MLDADADADDSIDDELRKVLMLYRMHKSSKKNEHELQRQLRSNFDIVGTLGHGDHFGELGLLVRDGKGVRRAATCVALAFA